MKPALNHMAIIMDGNGRWAQARNRSRFIGHIRGAKVAKQTIEYCTDNNIPNLTLFAFSTENWFRPIKEVTFLMRLLVKQLEKERKNLVKNNIRFRTVGDLSRLPENVRRSIELSKTATQHNDGLTLTFALSFSGRQDLTFAMKNIAQQISDGTLKPEDVSEVVISNSMPSSFLPDPDLIIRTSGECRLSNFLLWQSAYSEIYIMEKMWPDVTKSDLNEAVTNYTQRNRRFGRTKEQMETTHRDETISYSNV